MLHGVSISVTGDTRQRPVQRLLICRAKHVLNLDPVILKRFVSNRLDPWPRMALLMDAGEVRGTVVLDCLGLRDMLGDRLRDLENVISAEATFPMVPVDRRRSFRVIRALADELLEVQLNIRCRLGLDWGSLRTIVYEIRPDSAATSSFGGCFSTAREMRGR